VGAYEELRPPDYMAGSGEEKEGAACITGRRDVSWGLLIA